MARRGRADEEEDDADLAAEGGAMGVARRVALGVAIVLGVAAALYYPIGMVVLHTIDDNTSFQAAAPPTGPATASRAVAMAAALIGREVDDHAWVANDPIFLPGWALDNMAHYQIGVVAALAQFVGELNTQVTRTRAPQRPDQDLDRAAGLLRYSGTVWIFDLGTALDQTSSSESQFRTARKALLAFNERAAGRVGTLDRRPEMLAALVERAIADLGTMAQRIDLHLNERSGNILDFQVDNTFYDTKGRLYAYAMLLRELGRDFERPLGGDAARPWKEALDSLRIAGAMQPWIVMNGAPDGQFFPSHLAQQGFYVLRSQALLRDVLALLRK